MPNEFLSELDHWVLAELQQQVAASAHGVAPEPIGATHLSRMIADYVLLRIAADPASCWTACGIDDVPNDEILAATTFNPELLAAAFIGSVCELSPWQGDEGVAFMAENGVPLDDAHEVAEAIEVVANKLGARGQEVIHQLTGHVPLPEEPALTA